VVYHNDWINNECSFLTLDIVMLLHYDAFGFINLVKHCWSIVTAAHYYSFLLLSLLLLWFLLYDSVVNVVVVKSGPNC
jgi:hypothetical protein